MAAKLNKNYVISVNFDSLKVTKIIKSFIRLFVLFLN